MGTVLSEEPNGRVYQNNYQPDGTNRITASRTFNVRSDNNSEGARSILGSSALPSPGDAHPDDGTIFARTAAARQSTRDPVMWLVVVGYDDQVTRRQPDGEWPDPDPTKEPIRIEYSFERYSKLASGAGSWDKTNGEYQVGLLNGAGEPFDPQPEIDASRPTFVFTENKSIVDFDWAVLEDFQDAVNDAALWTKEIGTLKIQSITAGAIETVKISENPDVTVQFRVVTYVVQYRAEGWSLKVLNQGNFTNVDPNNPTQQIAVKQSGARYYFVDGGNNPITALLGAETAPGNRDAPFLPAGQDPTYIELDVFEAKDFSTLGLPDPYA